VTLTRKEQFVASLWEVCLAYQRAVMNDLKGPAGRSPHPGDIRRSKWFRSLSTKDQEAVREVVLFAVGSAVFGVLCELDGVGSVPGTPEQGMYELRYREGDVDYLITDPDEHLLHDLFRPYMDPLDS
jgi:hypothetical protein